MALRRTRTILFGLTGLAVAGGMAGLGTFATFTSSTSASQTLATGTVAIGIGAADSTTNRLTIGATGMVPGDTVQRRVVLTNSGSQNLASVALTTVATTSSVLDTDTSNGLVTKIEKCSTAWLESASAPYTYTCPLGTVTEVLAERDIIGSGLTLSSLSSLTAGQSDDLRVTTTLPTGADNSFQGKSSTIQFTFLATQRDGAAK